ncbi:helix-turn-helix transcriptional regulator [Novosphingobium sp.]|uniref:helix-turn-helix transcriptional regulator n=1 Tax=Novosphingobium sp. TaxID=1874826 RepID=UPI00286DDDA3|nr:helix-turn-helix transcriptional regulator [Novosphingobium sp.]
MAGDDKNGGPNHLKAWREFRDLTQADLADAVNTNSNMIGYLESGERSLSLKWLRRLAPALDTNVGMLAQYDPRDLDRDLIEIWATVSNRDKAKIVEIAKLLAERDGTTG